jgi:hypothetical protein
MNSLIKQHPSDRLKRIAAHKLTEKQHFMSEDDALLMERLMITGYLGSEFECLIEP